MMIHTKISYPDLRYATPKSKRQKAVQVEEFVDIELKEVSQSNLIPAFIYQMTPTMPQITVYSYADRLYVHALAEDVNPTASYYGNALEALKYYYKTTRLFTDHRYYDYIGRHPRLSMIAKAEAHLSRYLALNSGSAVAPFYTLMREVCEPLYCVATIGSGAGDGGTILYPTLESNRNLPPERFFSALDGEWAIKYANELAKSRGDAEDIGTFAATIQVLKEDECLWPRRDQNGNIREFVPC